MQRIIILFLILLFPSTSYADEGLNFSCMNMLSVLGKKYEPLNFKFEAAGFHYFDEKTNNFKMIPSNELEMGEDHFVVRFADYELGFQRIVFEGETEPTITMSKYDLINKKFLDHYKCTTESVYID